MSLFGGKRKTVSEPGAAGSANTPPRGGTESRRSDAGARPLDAGQRTPAKHSILGGEEMANIGKSVSIKGDLKGNEDLVIDGNVDGKIELGNSQLTVGPNGNVSAEVNAKSVVVVGHLTGNVTATERVEIQGSGVLEGDVRSPRLVIAEGGVLNGAVEMGSKKAEPTALPRPPAAASERSSAG